MSFKNNKVSSNLLYFAIALWVLSLGLPALIFFGDDRVTYGITILLEGWGGLLSGSFAWLANIFLIYCIFTAQTHNKIPLAPALIAILLAGTTFLFQESINMNIGSLRLYGYGIGVYVWLLAICLNLLAASTHRLEGKFSRLNINIVLKDIPSLISIILILFYTALFSIYGIKDHINGGLAEQPYLSSTVFKRGKVCELPDIKINNSIVLNEPLEVVVTGKNVPPYDDVLSHPEKLLAWGIPIVRFNGFDYALQNKSDADSVFVSPAVGESNTLLSVNYLNWGVIEAKLIKADKNKKTTVFEAHWENKDLNDVYCPRYIEMKNQTDDPLKSLITSSLLASDKTTFKSATKYNLRETSKPENLTIVSQNIIGKLSKNNISRNINCPENTGLLSVIDEPGWSAKTKGLKISTNYIFEQKNKKITIHDLPGFYSGNTTVCKSESVYFLFTEHISNQANYPDTFLIQKRSIDNLNMWDWSKSIHLNHFDLGVNDASVSYKLLSVEEKDNDLLMRIAVFTKDIADGDIIEIIAK